AVTEAFFPGADVTIADPPVGDVRLPFASRSFAVGLAFDTNAQLEPATPAFLGELRRVCDVVVVSAPFAGEAVVRATEALDEFVRPRLGAAFPVPRSTGTPGLPDLDLTVGAIEADGWCAATLPSGYLPQWMVAMLVRYDLLANGVPELKRLNAFYNSLVS